MVSPCWSGMSKAVFKEEEDLHEFWHLSRVRTGSSRKKQPKRLMEPEENVQSDVWCPGGLDRMVLELGERCRHGATTKLGSRLRGNHRNKIV